MKDLLSKLKPSLKKNDDEANKKTKTSKKKFAWFAKFAKFARFGMNTNGGAVLLGGERDRLRLIVVVTVMFLCIGVLVYRAVQVQLTKREAYLEWGDDFLLTTLTQPVIRGMIKDRFGTPLAGDAPMVVMGFSPYDYAQTYYSLKKQLLDAKEDEEKRRIQARLDRMDLKVLAQVSGVSLKDLQTRTNIQEHIDVKNKEAVKQALPYRKNKEEGKENELLLNSKHEPIPDRWMTLLNGAIPSKAVPLESLNFVGVSKQEVYRRFYLQGEPVSQVVGFMSELPEAPNPAKRDYQSRSGVELKYDKELAGAKGRAVFLRGANKKVIRQVKEEIPVTPSQDITLTIDTRLQHVLYQELERAGRTQEAMWASGIITDINTGEVLAVGSWPAFNGDVNTIKAGNERLRAVEDIFESGSVMKPFTIIAALESGKYNTNTWIDTAPGFIRVGGVRFRDSQNYGAMTLSDIIQKSSNVGIVKIALNLPKNAIYDIQKRFGFGQITALEMPREHAGHLNPPSDKDISRRANLGFGYGQDVTLVQLAQAYGALGAGGVMHPLRINAFDPPKQPIQVANPRHTQAVLTMMERATMKGGTGTEAAINGYRVAGKTGTAKRSQGKAGYIQGEYRNLFAGVAPASNPRFAVVILIEAPQKDKTAGKTAAPVFSRVMGETLRIYNVPFDKPLDTPEDKANKQ